MLHNGVLGFNFSTQSPYQIERSQRRSLNKETREGLCLSFHLRTMSGPDPLLLLTYSSSTNRVCYVLGT